MSNIKIIPFTECVERVQDLSRSNAETRSRIRGMVNEIYTLTIPTEFDWTWLKTSSAITCTAQYNTGVATVSTAGTTVTFGSGATLDASFTGRRIKFNGNDDLYNLTYATPSTATISPPLSGTANIGSSPYVIFKNIFSLPGDFDRFPVNGGLLYYYNGQPTPLPEKIDDDHYALANYNPSSKPDYCRMIGYDTAGNEQVEVMSPPSDPIILVNEYIRTLAPMLENSMGTISVTSGGSLVSGNNTYFTQMSTGDYLRADAFGVCNNSTWYQIKQITNDTTLTISPVFRTDTSYTGIFTISDAPQMPYNFHPALIWGAISKILTDQKDPMLAVASREYASIITDNKAIVQTRHSKDDLELIAENVLYRF